MANLHDNVDQRKLLDDIQLNERMIPSLYKEIQSQQRHVETNMLELCEKKRHQVNEIQMIFHYTILYGPHY